MAWTTPPTLSDGTVGTDEDLNILVEDIEYLYTLDLLVSNIGFNGLTSTNDLNEDDHRGSFIHLHRYLHFHIELEQGTIQDLVIRYNDYNVYEDASNHSAPYVYDGYVDLYDTGVLAVTPDIGDVCTVWANIDFTSGTNEVHVQYIIESPETIL